MPFELANVPQILSMLHDKTGALLSEGAKSQIDAFSKEKRIFAGEAAVQSGLVSPAELEASLLKQSAMKAEAAGKDIATITEKGTQDKPPFLKANWGNNGVNKPVANPTLIDASQSAANFAQNIVMLANDKPELAKELQPAVASAVALAKNLADPVKAGKLSNEERTRLTEEAVTGLKTAVEKSGVKLMAGSTEIQLDDFIKARTQEIDQGHSNHKIGTLKALLGKIDTGHVHTDITGRDQMRGTGDGKISDVEAINAIKNGVIVTGVDTQRQFIYGKNAAQDIIAAAQSVGLDEMKKHPELLGSVMAVANANGTKLDFAQKNTDHNVNPSTGLETPSVPTIASRNGRIVSAIKSIIFHYFFLFDGMN